MLFRLITLAILAAFYGVYLFKMLRQMRQGIRTDQLGRGKAGGVLAVEIGVKLASWLVVAAQVASVILCDFDGPLWLSVTGAVLGGLGVAVFILSVAQMGDSWRAGVSDEKTALVTTGIYRVSRNPAFLGFDLVYLGTALMAWSQPLAALSAVGMVMLHLQIVVVEEPHLMTAFGKEYEAYRRRTLRYLGRRREHKL